MVKFTKEQLLKLYKIMGLKDPKFFNEKEIVNLYKLLKIEPQKNEDGTRVLTPYEILGVLPVFKNGKEKPIVFAIKHRALKIGKYEGQITKFIYAKSKVKEEKNILQTLKEKYRAAIFAGNLDEADSCLKMIDELTGGRSSEFKDSFYDYSVYYKRMKKQLLLDLFSHFFLMYVQKKSSIIKEGIILKNKIYKPYKEKQKEMQDDLNNAASAIYNASLIDPVEYGLKSINKVVISDKEMGDIIQFDINKKDIRVKTSQSYAENIANNSSKSVDETLMSGITIYGDNNIAQKPQDDLSFKNDISEEKSEKGISGFFKSFIKKSKKVFRKMKNVPEDMQEEEESSAYSVKKESLKEMEK